MRRKEGEIFEAHATVPMIVHLVITKHSLTEFTINYPVAPDNTTPADSEQQLCSLPLPLINLIWPSESVSVQCPPSTTAIAHMYPQLMKIDNKTTTTTYQPK